MTKEFKNKIELAIKSVRDAQMEVHTDGSTYEQLDNIQNILADMLED